MKRLFYLATVAILLLSSCERNTSTTTAETSKVPQREGIQWGEFIPANNGNSFLLPYRTADGNEDTLSCDLQFCGFSELGDILEDDINFDGIPDVEIWLGPQNWWGNILYEGFLWNKEKGCFEWVEKYHEIFSPEIHQDSMYILGSDYFSFEGYYTTTYTKYEWIDGELVETDSWNMDGSTWGDDEDGLLWDFGGDENDDEDDDDLWEDEDE